MRKCEKVTFSFCAGAYMYAKINTCRLIPMEIHYIKKRLLKCNCEIEIFLHRVENSAKFKT